jgi:hypothetical protein
MELKFSSANAVEPFSKSVLLDHHGYNVGRTPKAKDYVLPIPL